VRPGVQIPAASGLDVAPTLLYALGLPSARDFDGRVLAEAFEPALLQSRALGFVPSFEGLRPVRRGRRRAP
ncbi:MAG TPA: phosphodiesterase, partial [Thermoanaerobaculia bacterium]|nr:phosphodiesterase [Thermoanaerobaculia bacterium]